MQMPKIKTSKIINLVAMIVLFSVISQATGINCPRSINETSDVLIANWNLLPFKNQNVENQTRVNQINQIGPNAGNWSLEQTKTAFKCLSYAASTSNDWFNLNYCDFDFCNDDDAVKHR